MDGAHGDGDFVDVVVEGAEELRPEEGLEAAVLEQGPESGVRHARKRARTRPLRKSFRINGSAVWRWS